MAPPLQPIYLDNNATTPIDPQVLEAMLPYLRERFGNPSSAHALGEPAHDAVERARVEVAALIGAAADEIVFTSGGTEASNMAIRGAATVNPALRAVVTTNIEHPATDACCALLERAGHPIRRLAAKADGRVDAADASALIGTDAAWAAQAVTHWGFAIEPATLTALAHQVGETTILSRTGGAPTLAVGMSRILSHMAGGGALTAFWYHFAILFEALFILTTIDAGTRVARFMTQDLFGLIHPQWGRTQSFAGNLAATAVCVAGWGWFLYQGVVDPLGGINTLWPLFGIANQMLAAIALMLCTVVVVKLKRERYLWVPGIPAVWLVACTLTAGWEKLSGPISFTAAANKYAQGVADGRLIAPAKTAEEMQRIVTNNYVDMVLTGLFMALVVAMALFVLNAIARAMRANHPTAHEEPYVAMSSVTQP